MRKLVTRLVLALLALGVAAGATSSATAKPLPDVLTELCETARCYVGP